MKCELSARNFEADEKIKEYATEKLGRLEKYLPKRSRDNAACSILLEEDPSGREDNRFVCEAVVEVDGARMISREGTVNMYAAIDIVEAKLKAQFSRYKAKLMFRPRRLRMLYRLVGRDSQENNSSPEQDII